MGVCIDKWAASAWRDRARSTTTTTMKQFGLGLSLSTKKTRKREFLQEIERVVPWRVLVQMVEPVLPQGEDGSPAVRRRDDAAHSIRAAHCDG